MPSRYSPANGITQTTECVACVAFEWFGSGREKHIILVFPRPLVGDVSGARVCLVNG